MADSILSVAVERIAALMEEQIRNEVNLVRDVEKEVWSLSTELNTITKVLDDAERRRFMDKNVNYWMRRLEHMAYEMDDVLDKWNYAILKLKMEYESKNDVVAPPKQKKVYSFIPSSPCLCFKKIVVRRDIATKIKSVKEQLDELLKEKDRYKFLESQPITDPSTKSWRVQSTSLIDLDEVLGREFDTHILVNKLIVSNNGSGQGELDSLHILSIVGVGGIGKTTLAQKVYNDSRVMDCFELRIWICVSDPFDEAAIAKGIIEKVGVRSCPTTDQLDILCECLIESIRGKKFLLVLDDVWSENYNKWEPLKNSLKRGAAGSVILVTTRNEKVVKMMGSTENDIHHLGQLSDEDCWFLLSRIAFSGRNKEESKRLENIGENIAKKCKGLPLAAKTLGSLLRTKNTLEEWENILDSEIWEVKEAEVELFPHLLLSYNELSPELKRCFSYCAVFPKDFIIEVAGVIRKWMAQGYLGFNIENSGGDMEHKGREYFNILAMHSLFQDFKKDDMDEQIESFKMHDIVHDFAQFLRKNSSSSRVEDVGLRKTTCRVCSNPSVVSSVKEYRSLFLQSREGPLVNICDCLRSLRALGLSSCGLRSIPQGMEKLIHLRWLDLSRNNALHGENITTMCKLYKLEFLCLSFCSLKEIPREIENLIHLRHLDLEGNGLREIPREIWNLIQLRHLDMSHNDLEEISMEIGKLIRLRHLDVGFNQNLMELPESLCGLHELRTLIVRWCTSLVGLPQGTFDRLKNLDNFSTRPCFRFPQGLAQFTGLRRLSEFHGGSGWNKLGWLKNLNSLSGYLKVCVRLSTDDNDDLEVDVVEDAGEAELRKKIHIQTLCIWFEDALEEEEDEEESYSSSSRVRMDVIDALEPHPCLPTLSIHYYKGSKLPGWIASLNQLTCIYLKSCKNLSSFSPLAKLPLLERLDMEEMDGLQILGREFFFGTTASTTRDTEIESSSSSAMPAANTINIAFPKLKELTFFDCNNWKEWEDITAKEEDSTTVSLMPCLKELRIQSCTSLMELPHHLLRKLSSLDMLHIGGSTQLKQRYGDKDGSAWKSISHNNPHLQLL